MPRDESNIEGEPLAQRVVSANERLQLRVIPDEPIGHRRGYFTAERDAT